MYEGSKDVLKSGVGYRLVIALNAYSILMIHLLSSDEVIRCEHCGVTFTNLQDKE